LARSWKQKKFILGTFSVIGATCFPVVHPLISVYVALTDGRGKTPVKLQLLGADEEDGVLFEGEMEIEWQDPRMVVELTFAMANITFPRPGEYRFCLFGANEFILERRILIRQFTAKE
jgi:hypothetical protein